MGCGIWDTGGIGLILMSVGAEGEEFAEGGEVGLVGAGFDPVEAFFAHAGLEGGAAFLRQLCITLAKFTVAGVDLDHFAGLGVFQCDEPNFR